MPRLMPRGSRQLHTTACNAARRRALNPRKKAAAHPSPACARSRAMPQPLSYLSMDPRPGESLSVMGIQSEDLEPPIARVDLPQDQVPVGAVKKTRVRFDEFDQ